MVRRNIQLTSVERVKEFTAAMGEFGFDVDLSSGRYTVNGKSIMAIFSLDLAQSLVVIAEPPQEQEARFLEVLEPFCV